MNDEIQFTLLAIVGVIMALIGVSFIVPGGAGSLTASAFASVNFSLFDAQGKFLISFDNFENIHTVVLDENHKVSLFDIERGSDENMFWIGSDSGLFVSRDGGLTWNQFATSDNEITSASSVFALLSVASNGKEFLISVFENGVGTVYFTRDGFFSLEKVVNFADEVPYDLYLAQDRLYLAMSTGQLIRYNLSQDHARVVNTFKSPIVDISVASDGYVYLRFGSGALARGTSLLDEFELIRAPRRGFLSLFGGAPVRIFDWDKYGNVYILSGNAVYVSSDSGKTFVSFSSIPLTREKIDALSVHGSVIRVISGRRMYTSYDLGSNWHIQDLPNTFPINHIYMIGERVILGQ